MKVLIRQLALPLDYGMADVRALAARALEVAPEALGDVRIVRRSIDARLRRGRPLFILGVEAELDDPAVPPRAGPNVEIIEETSAPALPAPVLLRADAPRPIVIGAGPAGLLAALTLADAGLRPLVLERGRQATDRSRCVDRFWRNGDLDPESNVLYGEGGAGLFSDGKLTARSKDRPGVRKVLETLAACGASEEILVDAEPHLGSDVLLRIVPALREWIESGGGEVRFGARVDSLLAEGGALRGVVAAGEEIETDACILATGHSARDTYAMLAEAGAALEPKAFAVGVRVELPQRRVDRAQWGPWAGHPRLGAASFRLSRRGGSGARACYSFCMCPGGSVIACASSPGMLTTNGMSLSRRDGVWANAAVLVPVGPEDFPEGVHPPALAGCSFQEAIERKAFEAGGGDYSVPAAALSDFLAARSGGALPESRSCSRARAADVRQLLPGFVADTLAAAMPRMLHLLDGVREEEVLVYAAETRSSSPVRVVRDGAGQSTTVAGLFPAGEGAGYSGGIVSSAVDGIRAAEAVLRARVG